MYKIKLERRMYSGFSIGAAAVAIALAAAPTPLTAEVTLRARVIEIEPEAYVRIHWVWGGQGLGGDPYGGEFTSVALKDAKSGVKPTSSVSGTDALDQLLVGEEPIGVAEYMVEKGKASDFHWLGKGIWSPELPVTDFKGGRLTVSADGCAPGDIKKRVQIKRAIFEFEVLEDGKSVKTFTEASPWDAVCTINMPHKLLKDGKVTPAFLEEARGLSQLINWRKEYMENLPWAQDDLPEHYEIITDCGGYSEKRGFGVRTSSREIMYDEFKIMRQMGINGLRNRPSFFMDYVTENRPEVQGFGKLTEGGAGGYPFVSAPRDRSTGRLGALPWAEGVGCPWHPVHSNRVETAKKRVAETIERNRNMPFQSTWDLTVDEIGSAFDGAAEGKAHQGTCPHCTAKFREFLKNKGLTPKDFDAKSWDSIRSTYGYFEKSHEQKMKEEAEARERDRPKPMAPGDIQSVSGKEADSLLGVAAADKGSIAARPAMTRDDTVVDLSDEEAAGKAGSDVALALAEDAARQGISPSPTPELSARGWHKLQYWSRRFNNEGSAMLFTPVRDAYAEANAAKKKAIAEGRLNSPEAKQPWLFMYALRGNTFLMGGHSLDFFDFYRHTDTAFVYETSNRDARVWQWDSYLCDVGRVLSEKMDLGFGIYVKPHRGAHTPRALSAVARGARYLYWYTYGPDWAKGDTFGGNTNVMAEVSRSARLIGEAETVTWGGEWSKPAEIAVVRPLTSEYFGNSAQWEDGKWVYTALMHSHLPMDPLDEEFLLSEDIDRYKAIYITGSHIRRDVVPRLIKYVEDGGTIFTGCGGMLRDEAGQLIDELLPVFGLKERADPQLWGNVPRYGASSLGAVKAITNTPPDAIVITTENQTGFPLQVGYEKLQPTDGAKVLAKFGDGSAAMVRNAYGKGNAFIAGWYSGVEYATGVMKEEYNPVVDFSAEKRALIATAAADAGVLPVVAASEPLIEGVRVIIKESGREAVLLMNWGFIGRKAIEFDNVTVTIPDAGAFNGAYSIGQRKKLEVVKKGDTLVVDIGEMVESDVLLLE